MVSKTLPVKPTPPLAESIGTVIALPIGNSPNVLEYHFLIISAMGVSKIVLRQGQYCVTTSQEGLVIGRIEQISILNTYFQDTQTLKNFASANLNVRNYLPSDQWECQIAHIGVLGVIPDISTFHYLLDAELFKHLDKPGFPVKPGNDIFLLEGSYLKNFLGIDEHGLNVGNLKYYPIDVKLDLNRLFQKHLAILAQSGAGKSYLISVLIEEILLRDERLGRPALILLDMHGEYHYLSERESTATISDTKQRTELEDAQRRIQHYNASFLQIGIPNLSEYDFQHFQPAISLPQQRVLRKAIGMCRQRTSFPSNNSDPKLIVNSGFDLKDLIFAINDDPEANSKVKETLVAWLWDLDHLSFFAKNESPSIQEIVRPGQLSIIDFSGIVSMRKKQILTYYFSSRIFQSRRSGMVSPFILFVEEAHNFLPESGGSEALAKGILETIAREGRKFYAQLVLISQRPVRLSTTALSQCNTQIIMRITNPYDLDHIKRTSEALSGDAIKLVTTLPTGNGLLLGTALNFPIFFRVRTRTISNHRGEVSLTDICQEYQKKNYLNVLNPSPDSLSEEELMDLDFSIVKE